VGSARMRYNKRRVLERVQQEETVGWRKGRKGEKDQSRDLGDVGKPSAGARVRENDGIRVGRVETRVRARFQHTPTSEARCGACTSRFLGRRGMMRGQARDRASAGVRVCVPIWCRAMGSAAAAGVAATGVQG
jgi:hypothetical protein